MNAEQNVLHGLKGLYRAFIRARISNTPCVIESAPGMGKTSVTQHLAETLPEIVPHNFDPEKCDKGWRPRVHSIYVGRHEEYEFPGMPWGREDGMHIHTHPLLSALGYGDFLIFDEFYLRGCNKMALQALQGERMHIAGWRGPECLTRIALANGMEDGAIECVQNPVTGNRMAQYRWTGPTTDEWVTEFALPNQLHPIIVTGVKLEGDKLLKDFDPMRMRNATPRSIHNASRDMYALEQYEGSNVTHSQRLEVLASWMHDAAAQQFATLFHLRDKLVPFDQLLTDPSGVQIPSDPATLMMTVAMVSNRTDNHNFSDVMKFVERLPLEMRPTVVDPVLRRHPALHSDQAAQRYTLDTAPLRVSH